MRFASAPAVTLFLLPLAPAPPPVSAQTKPQIHLVGAAEIVESRLRLTSAIRQTAGAGWFAEKQRVSSGFEVTFQFQLTDQGGLGPGADGFAFVLQNEGPDALAGRGSAGGFALGDGFRDRSRPGIPRSIAVFFDTFQNGDADDPSDNYVAICTNGPVGKMRWPPSRLGVSRKLKPRLKDGRVHTARIVYKPPVISVSLDDGEPIVRAPVDFSTIVDASGSAYVGFTASTGNGFQNHDILGWSLVPDVSSAMFTVDSEIRFMPTNCLDGRNLCTPASAIVEEKEPGLYHVILPAHLEWGASIPNPEAKPAVIAEARGSVCWSADECGGPDGVAAAQTDALLAPNRNPGALIVKTEHGRTWFSVNGRRGRDFSKNQGFFEFDVRLK